MKSIMRVLYQFVEEQNIEKNYLDSEHEKYQEAAYNQFEKIVKEYPQLLEPLDQFVSDLRVCQSYEQEALFQVGFLLYGELSRLLQSYSNILD